VWFIVVVALVLLALVFLETSRGQQRPGKTRLAIEGLETRLTPSTYQVNNIAYANQSSQQVLDVFSDTTYTNAPVVFLVHAGGWTSGTKSGPEDNYANYFLSQGFVVVGVDYRLVSPAQPGAASYTNQFPIPVDDVASAITWFDQHASQYGANPNEQVLLGVSAGAQIASLIAFAPTAFNNWGQPAPIHVSGFIGDSGPYDWPLVGSHWQIPAYLGSYYGSPAWNPTEPITYAVPGMTLTPALIIDGTDDAFTNYQNSTAFVSALQAAGDTVTYQLYNGYGHTEFTSKFENSPAEQAVVTSYLASIGF
jgi:acetyl esterase/lipase